MKQDFCPRKKFDCGAYDESDKWTQEMDWRGANYSKHFKHFTEILPFHKNSQHS